MTVGQQYKSHFQKHLTRKIKGQGKKPEEHGNEYGIS